jgi:hypothetical protein
MSSGLSRGRFWAEIERIFHDFMHKTDVFQREKNQLIPIKKLRKGIPFKLANTPTFYHFLFYYITKSPQSQWTITKKSCEFRQISLHLERTK